VLMTMFQVVMSVCSVQPLGFSCRTQVVTMVGDDQPEVQKQQRNAFLQEVDNMRRLNKSPHVVRIFGMVTSIPRLVSMSPS